MNRIRRGRIDRDAISASYERLRSSLTVYRPARYPDKTGRKRPFLWVQQLQHMDSGARRMGPSEILLQG